MSLKGTIRDSWDVWRRKVDNALGGSVEDIKASEVIFDKTGTTLNATDVEEAIKELDTNIGNLSADDIAFDNDETTLSATDVEGAIKEINTNIGNLSAEDIAFDNDGTTLVATDVDGAIKEVDTNVGTINTTLASLDGFMLAGLLIGSVEVTGDGVKTNGEILSSLFNALVDYLDTLEDDEAIELKVVEMQGVSSAPLSTDGFFTKADKPASIFGNRTYATTSTGRLNVVTFSADDTTGSIVLCGVLNGASSATDVSSNAYTDGNKAKITFIKYKVM